MSSNTLNSVHSIFPTTRLAPLKIILAVLILAYGAFNFSAQHWVILGLIIAVILAFADRISRINASYESETPAALRSSNRDGGSFRATDKSRAVRSGRSLVNDGGS